MTTSGVLRWDLFCRVIDNYGDVGVCWRLARDLGARGHAVRLWLDDARALAWMAPQGAPGVSVLAWREPMPAVEPGEVVVEAFGCDPPPAFVERMRARPRPPVWINLEYLSAEGYAERSHRLPSPQPGGLVKWFFYPGFTPASGGLLREPGLLDERRDFARAPWLAAHGVTVQPEERLVSLFAYPQAPIDALLDRLCAMGRVRLLATAAVVAEVAPRAGLVLQRLPWLAQPDFDRLLWSCDLNLVRGEDSLVRAIWAGAPFIWHIYPQHDGAHAAKLDALLDRMQAPPPLRALWRAWNGLAPWPSALPDAAGWRADARRWRDEQANLTDLTTRLLGFVAERAARTTAAQGRER